jgi:hypothetical protein
MSWWMQATQVNNFSQATVHRPQFYFKWLVKPIKILVIYGNASVTKHGVFTIALPRFSQTFDETQ